MKSLFLLAGAAALASAGAAQAKPPHAKGHQGHGQHVVGHHCPPGLAKKNAMCMPPGQYKKLFEVGQRVPLGYKGLLGYNALPYDLRSQYGQRLDPYGRYVYDQNYLYRVDPTTMIVSEILRAVL